VKERIPDYVLGMADQLVNVDVSAEDLRERLQAGKVYPQDRIATALQNFFTQANLTRLREFALEEIAHRLDRRRNDESGAEARAGSDRVMICLSSRSPNVEGLLRKGARLADRLKAQWYALYIQTPKEELDRIDAATQRHIINTQTLIQQMGGIPLTGKGSDIVSTIAVFAKEYGITHIIMGRTRQPWYRRRFRQSVLDRLLRTLPEVDVHIVGNPEAGDVE
jgi:two-component system sensor histidine kinase KdpD